MKRNNLLAARIFSLAVVLLLFTSTLAHASSFSSSLDENIITKITGLISAIGKSSAFDQPADKSLEAWTNFILNANMSMEEFIEFANAPTLICSTTGEKVLERGNDVYRYGCLFVSKNQGESTLFFESKGELVDIITSDPDAVAESDKGSSVAKIRVRTSELYNYRTTIILYYKFSDFSISGYFKALGLFSSQTQQTIECVKYLPPPADWCPNGEVVSKMESNGCYSAPYCLVCGNKNCEKDFGENEISCQEDCAPWKSGGAYYTAIEQLQAQEAAASFIPSDLASCNCKGDEICVAANDVNICLDINDLYKKEGLKFEAIHSCGDGICGENENCGMDCKMEEGPTIEFDASDEVKKQVELKTFIEFKQFLSFIHAYEMLGTVKELYETMYGYEALLTFDIVPNELTDETALEIIKQMTTEGIYYLIGSEYMTFKSGGEEYKFTAVREVQNNYIPVVIEKNNMQIGNALIAVDFKPGRKITEEERAFKQKSEGLVQELTQMAQVQKEESLIDWSTVTNEQTERIIKALSEDELMRIIDGEIIFKDAYAIFLNNEGYIVVIQIQESESSFTIIGRFSKLWASFGRFTFAPLTLQLQNQIINAQNYQQLAQIQSDLEERFTNGEINQEQFDSLMNDLNEKAEEIKEAEAEKAAQEAAQKAAEEAKKAEEEAKKKAEEEAKKQEESWGDEAAKLGIGAGVGIAGQIDATSKSLDSVVIKQLNTISEALFKTSFDKLDSLRKDFLVINHNELSKVDLGILKEWEANGILDMLRDSKISFAISEVKGTQEIIILAHSKLPGFADDKGRVAETGYKVKIEYKSGEWGSSGTEVEDYHILEENKMITLENNKITIRDFYNLKGYDNAKLVSTNDIKIYALYQDGKPLGNIDITKSLEPQVKDLFKLTGCFISCDFKLFAQEVNNAVKGLLNDIGVKLGGVEYTNALEAENKIIFEGQEGTKITFDAKTNKMIYESDGKILWEGTGTLDENGKISGWLTGNEELILNTRNNKAMYLEWSHNNKVWSEVWSENGRITGEIKITSEVKAAEIAEAEKAQQGLFEAVKNKLISSAESTTIEKGAIQKIKEKLQQIKEQLTKGGYEEIKFFGYSGPSKLYSLDPSFEKMAEIQGSLLTKNLDLDDVNKMVDDLVKSGEGALVTEWYKAGAIDGEFNIVGKFDQAKMQKVFADVMESKGWTFELKVRRLQDAVSKVYTQELSLSDVNKMVQDLIKQGDGALVTEMYKGDAIKGEFNIVSEFNQDKMKEIFNKAMKGPGLYSDLKIKEFANMQAELAKNPTIETANKIVGGLEAGGDNKLITEMFKTGGISGGEMGNIVGDFDAGKMTSVLSGEIDSLKSTSSLDATLAASKLSSAVDSAKLLDVLGIGPLDFVPMAIFAGMAKYAAGMSNIPSSETNYLEQFFERQAVYEALELPFEALAFAYLGGPLGVIGAVALEIGVEDVLENIRLNENLVKIGMGDPNYGTVDAIKDTIVNGIADYFDFSWAESGWEGSDLYNVLAYEVGTIIRDQAQQDFDTALGEYVGASTANEILGLASKSENQVTIDAMHGLSELVIGTDFSLSDSTNVHSTIHEEYGANGELTKEGTVSFTNEQGELVSLGVETGDNNNLEITSITIKDTPSDPKGFQARETGIIETVFSMDMNEYGIMVNGENIVEDIVSGDKLGQLMETTDPVLAEILAYEIANEMKDALTAELQAKGFSSEEIEAIVSGIDASYSFDIVIEGNQENLDFLENYLQSGFQGRETGIITPAEQAEMDKLADMIDVHKDIQSKLGQGQHTQEEVNDIMVELFDLAKNADKNGDGIITDVERSSWNELMEMMGEDNMVVSDLAEKVYEETITATATMISIAGYADKDNNGEVSEAEQDWWNDLMSAMGEDSQLLTAEGMAMYNKNKQNQQKQQPAQKEPQTKAEINNKDGSKTVYEIVNGMLVITEVSKGGKVTSKDASVVVTTSGGEDLLISIGTMSHMKDADGTNKLAVETETVNINGEKVTRYKYYSYKDSKSGHLNAVIYDNDGNGPGQGDTLVVYSEGTSQTYTIGNIPADVLAYLQSKGALTQDMLENMQTRITYGSDAHKESLENLEPGESQIVWRDTDGDGHGDLPLIEIAGGGGSVGYQVANPRGMFVDLSNGAGTDIAAGTYDPATGEFTSGGEVYVKVGGKWVPKERASTNGS